MTREERKRLINIKELCDNSESPATLDTKFVLRLLDEAETEIANLRTMLTPFADAADNLDDETKNQSNIWELPAAMDISAGDLRRAREILKGKPVI